MMRLALLFGLGCLLSTSGCGSDGMDDEDGSVPSDSTVDGGSDPDAGSSWKDAAPIPLDELGDTLHEDLCVGLTECGWQDYRDVDDCLQGEALLGLDRLLDAIDAGEITYDPETAGQCHALFQLDPCGSPYFYFFSIPTADELLADCPMFDRGGFGTRQAGESCTTAVSCVSDARCEFATGCPGMCETLAGLDEPCDRVGGPECNWRENLSCIEGSCADMGPAYFPCTSSSDCEGAECLLTVGPHGLCAGARAEGETCDGNALRCNPDLFCDRVLDYLAETGHCQPLGEMGDECSSNADCRRDLVCIEAESDYPDNGTCRWQGGIGDPCDFGADCGADTYCNFEETCVARLEQGVSCDGDDQCSEGLACDGTCEPVAYHGESCAQGQLCQESLCEGGVCAHRREVGSECSIHAECQTFVCEDSMCVDPEICEA